MLIDTQGRLAVDFIGRFEHFERDFEKICRRIGIKANLPHINRTCHDDYRSYYSDALAQKVADRLAEDIECFAFTFDGTPDDAGLDPIVRAA